MDINFIALFFDEDYYSKNEGMLEVRQAGGDLWKHYQEHHINCNFEEITSCKHPNKYFAELAENSLERLFPENNATKAREYIFLHDEINNDTYSLLNDYFVQGEHNIITQQLRLASERNPEILEDLILHLREFGSFMIALAPFINNQAHVFKEGAINFIEQNFKALRQIGGIDILANYAAYHAENDSHALFLVDVARKNTLIHKSDDGVTPYLVAKFHEALQRGERFSEEVFNNFESLIGAEGLSQSLLSFLSLGAAYGLYKPSRNVMKILTELLQEDNLNHEIASKAIFSGLAAEIDSENPDIEYVERHIRDMFARHHKPPSSLIDKIIDQYDVASATASSNAEIQPYLNILEVIFTNHHRDIPRHTIERLTGVLQASIRHLNSTDPSFFQVFFLANRVLDANITFSNDALANLTIPLSQVGNPKLGLVAEEFANRVGFFPVQNDESASVVDLQRGGWGLSFYNLGANFYQQVYDGVVYYVNSFIGGYEVDPSDDILADLDEKLDVVTDRESQSKLADYMSYLHEHVGWQHDNIKQLAQCISAENFRYFDQAIERLYHYKVSDEIIDRAGNDALDIFETKKPEEWDDLIKRLVDDNNFNYPRDVEEIFEAIEQQNPGNPELVDGFIDFARDNFNKTKEEEQKLEELWANIEPVSGNGSEKVNKGEAIFFIDNGKVKCKTIDQNDEEAIWEISDPREKIKEKLSIFTETNYYLEQGYELVFTDDIRQQHIERDELYIYSAHDKIYYRVIQGDRYESKTLPRSLSFHEGREAIMYDRIANFLSQEEALDLGESEIAYMRQLYRDMWLYNYHKSVHPANIDIPEILAVCARAMHYSIFHEKYNVRDVQLISVLAELHSSGGRMLQINTGEGKTVIIDIHAAARVLNGLYVDILTSSEVLANRDYEEQKPFYDKLGITVASAAYQGRHDTPKECYKAQVVYGDSLHFEADEMQAALVDNYKFGRNKEILIIDEVDDAATDKTNMRTKLSMIMPGFSQLISIFLGSFSVFQKIMGYDVKDVDGVWYQLDEQKNLGEEIGDFEKLKHFATNKIQEYIHGYEVKDSEFNDYFSGSLSTKRHIFIPNHLRDFLEDHIDNWVNSFFASLGMKEDQEYVLRPVPQRNRTEIKIHNADTGVIHESMKYSHGLDQVLSFLHKLQIHPESLTSVFMSNVAFIKGYKGNIYGLTGTLGEEGHRNFLENVYETDSLNIPTFATQNLYIYPPQEYNTKDEYLQAIATSVFDRISEGRGVLVITRFIKDVNAVYDYLKKFLSENNVTRNADPIKYDLGKYQDNGDQTILQHPVKSGQIIVATNLGGRGTDLKLSPEVLEAGGLHVIEADYPTSSRVQYQAFGRAARKGEPGSAELIVFNDNPECDLNCMDTNRQKAEQDLMERFESVYIPMILLGDSLHEKHMLLGREINSPNGKYRLVENYDVAPETLEKFDIHVFHEGKNIFLQAQGLNNGKPVDFTNDIKDFNPSIYKHILAVLSNETKMLHLDRGDSELLFFLLAKNLITEDKTILVRLSQAYRSKVGNKQYSEDFIIVEPAAEEKFCQPELEFLKSEWHRRNIQDGEEREVTLVLKDLEELKENILFELWQEDRKHYNKKFELTQLRESFAIWFHAMEDKYNLNHFDLYDRDFVEYITEEMEKEWQKFASNVRAAVHAGTFIRNQAYDVQHAMHNIFDINVYNHDIGLKPGFETTFDLGFPECGNAFIIDEDETNAWQEISKTAYIVDPFDQAYSLLSKAIDKDYKFSAAAYHLRALVKILQNNDLTEYDTDTANKAADVKRQAFEDLEQAYYLYSISKSRKAGECVLYVSDSYSYSELLEGCLAQVAFYNRISENVDKERQIVIEASKNPKATLRFGSVQFASEIFGELNRQDMIAELGIITQNLAEQNTTSTANATNVEGAVNATFANTTSNNNDTVFNATLAASDTSTDVPLSHSEHLDDILRSLQAQFNPEVPQVNKFPEFVAEVEAQGIMAHNIKVVELKEEKDWMGTLFAGAVCGMLIATGMGMAAPGASTFFVSLGNSIAIGGASQLLSLSINAVQGHAVDMGTFFSGVAINLAVGIISAGISSIAASNGIEIFEKAAKNIKPMDFKGVATAATASQAIGFIAQKVASSYYGKNNGNIEAEVFERIYSLFEAHKDDLKAIFITDAYHHNKALQHKLQEIAGESLSKYSAKYHTVPISIAKRSAASVIATAAGTYFGGGYQGVWASQLVSDAAIDLPLGYEEASGALDHVVKKLKGELKGLAEQRPSTSAMMQGYLTSELSINAEKAQEIMDFIATAAEDSWFIVDGEIEYQQCNQIGEETFALGEYDTSRRAVQAACEDVAKFLKGQEVSFVSARKGLAEQLSRVIFSRVSNMWEQGVVQSIARLPFSVSWGLYQQHENQARQAEAEAEQAKLFENLRQAGERHNAGLHTRTEMGYVPGMSPVGSQSMPDVAGHEAARQNVGEVPGSVQPETTVEFGGEQYNALKDAKHAPTVNVGIHPPGTPDILNGQSYSPEAPPSPVRVEKSFWQRMADRAASSWQVTKDSVLSGLGSIVDFGKSAGSWVSATWDGWFSQKAPEVQAFADPEYERGYQQFKEVSFYKLGLLDLVSSRFSNWRSDAVVDEYLRVKYQYQQQTGKEASVSPHGLLAYSLGRDIEALEVKYPKQADWIKSVNSKIGRFIGEAVNNAVLMGMMPELQFVDPKVKEYAATALSDWVGKNIRPMIREYLDDVTPEQWKAIHFVEGVGNFMLVGEVAGILERKLTSYIVENGVLRKATCSMAEGFEPAFAYARAGEGRAGARAAAEEFDAGMHYRDNVGDGAGHNKPTTHTAADGVSHPKAPVKEEVHKVIQDSDGAKIREIFIEKHGWDIPNEVFDKIPGETFPDWRHNRQNVGIRFLDNNNGKTHSVRIDQGNPAADLPAQRVDHVRVTHNGQVIGRDGNVIHPAPGVMDPGSHPNAHIPLDEWVQWKEWRKP